MNFYFLIPKRLSLLVVFLIISQNVLFSQTKSWSLGVGTAITTYDFTTSAGNKIDYLKKGTGNSYAIGYEQAVVDTNKFVGQSTPKAIYFLQHKNLAKILTKIHVGVQVLLNQYNAVGNIQNVAFDYQTNYAGLQVSVGPKIAIGKKWSFVLKGIISGQHILQGNQHVNFSYIDLTKDDSFSGLKTFMGLDLRLEKQLNNSLSFYINGANSSTYHKQEPGVANLNFNSTSLQMGIKITGI